MRTTPFVPGAATMSLLDCSLVLSLHFASMNIVSVRVIVRASVRKSKEHKTKLMAGIDPDDIHNSLRSQLQSQSKKTVYQTLRSCSCGSHQHQSLLSFNITSPRMHFRSFTIPPLFEKKYYWVEKDNKGQLFLFRKKRKSYTYEKKVVKTREEHEYRPAHGPGRMNLNDPAKHHHAYSSRDKYRDDESRVYKHVHHHYFPDNPPPVLQPPLKSPPKNSPKNGARYPGMTPTVELPPHPAKLYRPVDADLTLRKVPVHNELQHGTRLESTKLERLRSQRYDDFESGRELEHKYEHEERERGRSKHRDHGFGYGYGADGDEDDHGYDSSSGSEMHHRRHVRRNSVRSPRGRGRSYSRARSVDESEYQEHEEHEEHASWDEDLGAYVVKRTPSVRFE